MTAIVGGDAEHFEIALIDDLGADVYERTEHLRHGATPITRVDERLLASTGQAGC